MLQKQIYKSSPEETQPLGNVLILTDPPAKNVSGFGPKTLLKILSSIGPGDAVRAHFSLRCGLCIYAHLSLPVTIFPFISFLKIITIIILGNLILKLFKKIFLAMQCGLQDFSSLTRD